MNTFLLNYYLKTSSHPLAAYSLKLLYIFQPIVLNKSPTADEKAHFCFQNCCEVLSCEVHVKYIFSLLTPSFPVLRPLFPLMVLFHCMVWHGTVQYVRQTSRCKPNTSMVADEIAQIKNQRKRNDI